jgi:hypothetical protein
MPLAPAEAHVASSSCQYFSYNLPGARDWRQEKQGAIHRFIATVDSYAPNFSARSRRKKPGPAGRDIFHGALGLGQLWAAQPMLGRGDDRTPVKNM